MTFIRFEPRRRIESATRSNGAIRLALHALAWLGGGVLAFLLCLLIVVGLALAVAYRTCHPSAG